MSNNTAKWISTACLSAAMVLCFVALGVMLNDPKWLDYWGMLPFNVLYILLCIAYLFKIHRHRNQR